jgi:site-specific recombinase XerD
VARVNFTIERVNSYEFDDGGNEKKMQSMLWDAKVPGLGVRATKGGAKSYIFEARLNGGSLRMTIGDTRSWTLGQAQAEAMRLKVLVDKGIDPRLESIERREKVQTAKLEAGRKAATVGDAWKVYIASRKPKWGDHTYADHVRLASLGGAAKKKGEGTTLPGPLAELLNIKLCDLRADTVVDWLNKQKASRPTSTALAFRLLRAFLIWLEDMPEYCGLVQRDIHRTRSVRDALPKSKTKDGDCIQKEQLQPWFDAVTRISSPVVRTYLIALLLTGARREEMATIRWDDVDLKWRMVTIRDKVDGTRTIPLPPYLTRLFQELKEWNESADTADNRTPLEKSSPWVFPSATSKSGHLAEPRLAHNEALQVAGLPHVSLHGLRRTFSTLSEWIEMPVGVCAQIMGHKPSAVAERHYRRRPLDMLRGWHDKLERWILNEAGVVVQPSTNEQDL